MKIALLTCANRPELYAQEQRIAQLLAQEGRSVHVEVWNDPAVDWSSFDCLIFRTIWDYYEYPEAFAAWLTAIQAQGIRTLNPAAVIAQNQHKFYLQTLESQGIAIIPTQFIPKGSTLDRRLFDLADGAKAVIKPAVSAGSYLTTLFDASTAAAVVETYQELAASRDLLLQPFMPEIQEEGEISLIFFNGSFSHSVRKRPKDNDFRVQVQYGGLYEPYTPDADLKETAARIVAAIGTPLLYARVDGVIHQGQFLLMEIELIEPDLYFDYHPEALNRYVAAVNQLLDA